MIFSELELEGAFVIELEPIPDERGFFARAWSDEEFKQRGLETRIAQCNIAYNDRKDTLRGLHFQTPPHSEVKLVRCTRGAVYDVIVDLRPESPTYLRWQAVELSAENGRMLYVPEGFAHGYQTRVDGTETFYLVSHPYVPAAQAGVRWDDPAFGIEWPEADERVISARDRAWPDYVPAVRPF